jgi:hypothetical protein
MSRLDAIVARGQAMRRFCDAVRERGDVAVVEEFEDLPALRAQFLIQRSIQRGRGRLRRAARRPR